MTITESERSDVSEAAQSFQDLWAEVNVMRKAVEKLEPALEEMRPIDHSAYLDRLAIIMKDFDKRLTVIEASPALRISPDHYGALLAHAGSGVFQDLVRPLRSDVNAIQREREALQLFMSNLANGFSQRRQRWLFGLIGVFVGLATIPAVSFFASVATR